MEPASDDQKRKEKIKEVQEKAEHVFDLVENMPQPSYIKSLKPITGKPQDYVDFKETWYALGSLEKDPTK